MASPVTAPPLYRRSSRVITEPDEFADAASGIDLRVDFQKRQERVSRVEQFQSAGWALDFGEANVKTRVRGVLNGGWASLCMARGPGEATWNGQAAPPGSISLLPPGAELEGRTTADFAWLTFAIPPSAWSRCLQIAGIRERAPQQLMVCHLPEAVLTSLGHQLRQSHRLLTEGSDPTTIDQTSGFVSEAFTTACELASRAKPPRDSLRNRARLVRRATTWLQEHMAEAVQIPDLCLALGVSRRELEYAFRSVFDQSPRDYLEALRLNAIRRALLRADASRDTVINVAYAHGVTHLSRFAANYRVLFGENPAETLKG